LLVLLVLKLVSPRSVLPAELSTVEAAIPGPLLMMERYKLNMRFKTKDMMYEGKLEY